MISQRYDSPIERSSSAWISSSVVCLFNDKTIREFAQICELIERIPYIFPGLRTKRRSVGHTQHYDNKSTRESRGRRIRNNTCFGQIKFLFPLYCSFILLDDKELELSEWEERREDVTSFWWLAAGWLWLILGAGQLQANNQTHRGRIQVNIHSIVPAYQLL